MKLFDRFKIESPCSALLFIWVLIASVVPNVWLSFTEPLTLVQALANVLLPLGIYILLMSLSPKIGRTSLWMIFIMFFAAFQMVLLYMYGRSVIAVDMFLNVATTNPGEVGELLGNILPIIAAVVIIYLTPIVMAIIGAVRKWRLTHNEILRFRRIGYYVLCAGIVIFGLCFAMPQPYSPLLQLYPLNVFNNVGIAVDRTLKLANYKATSAPFTYSAHSERPDTVPEIYVAVIGETSRADNWQLLGYGRRTTPALMSRSGLVAFNKALSQSNTTHKSVPLLLSPLTASDFGDSIYITKSFITAFKEAGFHTAFISNQKRNHSFIDFFGEEADTCMFIRDGRSADLPACYDTELLGYLDTMMKEGHKKLLVVLHTYGSHFNYIDRYPASEAFFKPDGPAEAISRYRREQINAYDNTVLLTSNLLASIIDRLDKDGVKSAMIYTSDHGEDIFDDERRLFLHASPCPSYYQIHVPFIVWMSPSLLADDPLLLQAALKNSGKRVSSSSSYFHTLMQLAAIASPRVDASQSVVDMSYNPSEASYLNDHNKIVNLREAGLLDEDFRKLDSLLNKR